MTRCRWCDTEKTDKHFGNYLDTCNSCRGIFNTLRQEGYSKESANEKMSYGVHREGKIAYWTMRLKRDKNG